MKNRALRILLLLCISAAATAQPRPEPDYKKPGAEIPPFAIERQDHKIVTNTAVQKGKTTVVAIFSPQCDHCAHALDTLRSMMQATHSTQLFLFTETRNEPFLKEFWHKHGFDTVKQFSNAGLDKGNIVWRIYTYGLLPQFNVYSPAGRLVHSFTGVFPMDSLRMMLH